MSSATDRSWSERLESLGFGILLFSLVLAPWPLGSNRPWAYAMLAALVWLALLMVVLAAAVSRVHAGPSEHQARWAWLPFAAFVAFAALIAFQLVPWRGGTTITIDPRHTTLYLLQTMTYLGAWFVVMRAVRTEQRAILLLATVVATGVLQALVAVLLYSSGAQYELFFASFDQGSRAMGTFVNPDHLAGYMELCLSAGLGWLIAQFGGRLGAGGGWRTKTVSALSFVMSQKMLLRLLIVVMVIALVMTHSRMGNGAFFLALTMVLVLLAMLSRELRRTALWLLLSIVLVDVIVIGQWVGLDRVVQRIQNTIQVAPEAGAGFGMSARPNEQEETLAQRLQVPMMSLQLVVQRPWFGHGGGTYYTAFPALKQEGYPLHWDHAHNDFVQVACDTGLVGLLLWVTIGLATLWRAMLLLRDGQVRANRGFGTAAVMALFCMGMHSMVDFNLHIPATALTFTILLALVWAVPGAARRSSRATSAGAPESVEAGVASAMAAP